MSMTVAALHKRLGALIEAGHGRKPVLVDKPSFQHPCEQDGVGMLELANVDGPKWIPISDDDGGTKWNKDGTEAGKTVVTLTGGWDDERRLVLPHDPIARALSVMDDVLRDIEDWEDQALAVAVREAQAGLRLAYPARDDGEPAAEVVKMETGGSWIERNRPLPIGTKLYTRPAGVALPAESRPVPAGRRECIQLGLVGDCHKGKLCPGCDGMPAAGVSRPDDQTKPPTADQSEAPN